MCELCLEDVDVKCVSYFLEMLMCKFNDAILLLSTRACGLMKNIEIDI